MLRLFPKGLLVLLCSFILSHGYSQTCNNWLRIPSQPGYVNVGDLDIPGNQITVEALFVRTQPYSHILYAGDLVSKHVQWTDVNYLLRPSTAEITTTSGYYITPEVCEIELNRIYHVAMVYDGATLKFYRDGFLLSQIAASGDLILNDWQTRIGLYEAGVFPENLIGYINEVRIWNVARTQQEIRDNMAISLSSPTTQTGLLAYYTFDNLLNKQGNPAWNGVLGGSATINNTIPNCSWVPIRCPNTADTVIVNHYTEVASFEACSNFLDVADASAFKVGDTVLLFQMKGGVVDSTNSSNFGSILDYGNAGNYEFNYVKSKSGNRLELLNVPERNFDFAQNLVQLIRVPYFQSYHSSAILSCLPWDGRKGGVLAFNVGSTLTLNENIDVSGRGFRGGADPFTSPSSLFCYENQFFYPPNPDLASQKGEGIALISLAKSYGKGALANGGGGGNSHNSGGGGGGNAGIGGLGGYNYELAPCNTQVPFDNRGLGGRPLGYSNSLNRAYLGGGGGGGQSNNQGFQARGGAGGGIVIISAPSVVSNGHQILANGLDGINCNGANLYCHEGMGGGGGGGTIILDIANFVDPALAASKGGKGGDMIASGLGRLGAGGGGGGGVVWVRGTGTSANLTTQVNGGLNGTNTAYSNDNWGATAGVDGNLIDGLQLPLTTTAFVPNIDSVRIAHSQVACNRFDFNGQGFVNSFPVASWQWSFGDGNSATNQNVSHTYSQPGLYPVKLVITDQNGCKDSIQIDLQVNDIQPSFEYLQNACDPFLVNFSGKGSAATSFWDFGDGNTSIGSSSLMHTYSEGVYVVKYVHGNGVCADTARKTITIRLVDGNTILTPDTSICIGSDKLLRGVVSDDFCWTPVAHLTNFDTHQPTTSTPVDFTYYYTARVSGANLLQNGDFGQGNAGFSSQYAYAPSSGLAAGTYHVTSNVTGWHAGLSSCADHTGSGGNMLVVNGSTQGGTVVWSQTVNVNQNTPYRFQGYFQSLTTANVPAVSLLVNGQKLRTVTGTPNVSCVWQPIDLFWNSENRTTLLLEIISESTIEAGNDFALDDLWFAETFYQRDSVKITVETPLVRTNADTTVCLGTPVQLNATGASTYSWAPAIYLNDPASANPVSTPLMPTEYIVSGTTAGGCVARDTVYVDLFAVPDITITNDTAICKNSSVELMAGGGVDYMWSPSASLNNPSIPNPVATPPANTMYYVTITDANTCQLRDSVLVGIHPDPVFAVSGNSSLCRGDSLQVFASGGDRYSWSPAASMNNSSVSNPIVFPNSSVDYSVTIVEDRCQESATLSTRVTVLPTPVVTASRSNDIDCTVSQSQLTANGAFQYNWSPAATLNSANIRNPIASPRETTSYVVKGEDAAGCFGYDTVQVKVEKINESQYLVPSAFTPNNDGLNDCFGIKFWGVVEELEFSIYNRWGERIFFSKDPAACWDGIYKGVRQDAGVYVYMLRARTSCTENVFRKGTFVLIR